MHIYMCCQFSCCSLLTLQSRIDLEIDKHPGEQNSGTNISGDVHGTGLSGKS